MPNVCAEKGQSARIKEPVYLSAGKMRQRLNATYVPWENALHTWKRLTETMVIVQETLMKNFLHRPDTMKDEGALEWGSAYIEPHTAFRPKQFWRRVRTDHLLESQRHYIRMCFKGSENDVYDDWFPPGWRKRLKEASQSEHQAQKSASVAVPEDQTREDRALSQGARTTERLRPMPTILWTDSSGSSSTSFSRSASSRQALLQESIRGDSIISSDPTQSSARTLQLDRILGEALARHNEEVERNEAAQALTQPPQQGPDAALAAATARTLQHQALFREVIARRRQDDVATLQELMARRRDEDVGRFEAVLAPRITTCLLYTSPSPRDRG